MSYISYLLPLFQTKLRRERFHSRERERDAIEAMSEGSRVFIIIPFVLLLFPSISTAKPQLYMFGPFNPKLPHDQNLVILGEADINSALQLTPDSLNDKVKLINQSGRVMMKNRFKLWEGDQATSSDHTIRLGNKVASFNTSFLINIYPINNSLPGEGLAFVIAPDLLHPPSSHGQYLGLTNATTDGNTTNQFIAIEFDTFRQDFDPDANHIGLDVNGVRSNKTVSLSELGFQLSQNVTVYFMVWIDYDGANKVLRVFMVDQDSDNITKTKPDGPIMTVDGLDIRDTVNQYSYFGFAASTGSAIELNCVLRWNLTVDEILDDSGLSKELKITIGVGVSFVVLLTCISVGCYYYYYYFRKASNDPNIVGTLKRLPGTPKEYKFRDLKKATNNFDEEMKLGKGGFGEVYKGVMPKEKVEIAVKKFSRDNTKRKDDFLAELTIINRLRHKHLVSLSGKS